METSTLTYKDIKKLPKVPQFFTEEILRANDFYSIKPGWYCIPVFNGLTVVNDLILSVAILQKSQEAANNACMIHNTYNGLLTKIESAKLIIVHSKTSSLDFQQS